MATFTVNNNNGAGSQDPSGNPTLAATGAAISYTPIGFGKPLSVEILTVYTGAFKKKGLFSGNKRDILCVSGAKASETFAATPRAINLLQQHVEENTFLEFSAFSASTPYIYYKNAVADNTIDITIELTVNSFNDSLFSAVATLMGKAAGLPIFMPVAGKLLAGSQLINMLQSGASDLFSSSPFLSETVTLRFDTAGLPTNTAQSMVICRDEDQTELSGYKVETVTLNGTIEMRLADNNGFYTGSSPYIIINLDGASKPDLQSWTATLASSSVLSEFYGNNDTDSTVSGTLQQAMGLYNDYTYFTKAINAGQQLQGMQSTDPQYAMLQSEYQAYVGNIQSATFLAQLPKLN